MDTSVCRCYNKKAVSDFKREGSMKKFLDPIGLYTTPATQSFANNLEHMTIQQEIDHFQAFHFVKYKLYNAYLTNKHIAFWQRMFIILRNRLISANLSLVYKCLKSSKIAMFHDKTEFISAGQIILLKAVERFDPWLNFRFSTYACKAISYKFMHVAIKLSKTTIDVTEMDVPEISKHDENEDFVIERVKIALNKSAMTKDEKQVIIMRFFQNKTLSDVGNVFGFTKERARQIQQRALQKMKQCIDADLSQVY